MNFETTLAPESSATHSPAANRHRSSLAAQARKIVDGFFDRSPLDKLPDGHVLVARAKAQPAPLASLDFAASRNSALPKGERFLLAAALHDVVGIRLVCRPFGVERGPDLDARDADGNTALHLAAATPGERALDAIRALIVEGVDINATNDRGQTAAQLARERGLEAVADALVRAAQIREAMPC